MHTKRCPYHVRQGIVDGKGELVLSDICGVKSAEGAHCEFAPFKKKCHTNCEIFGSQCAGGDRHILMPRDGIESGEPKLPGVRPEAEAS